MQDQYDQHEQGESKERQREQCRDVIPQHFQRRHRRQRAKGQQSPRRRLFHVTSLFFNLISINLIPILKNKKST